MKKLLAILLVVVLSLTSVVSLSGCSKKDDDKEATVADILKIAEGMTHEELVEAAKAEIGTNKFLYKGASSGVGKAAKQFGEEYGIAVEEATFGSKDSSTYQGLTTAMDSDSYAVDLLVLQDTAQMMTFVNAGDLLNYIPSTLEGVQESDQNPLTCLYACKQFTYTKATSDAEETLYNVWQLTGTGADPVEKLSVQDPTSEGINMSMLVMLTREDWQEKLKVAYKDYYGKDYVASADFKNIAYEFIDGFIRNVTSWHDSDTTTSKNLATGLYTINDAEPAGIAPGVVAYVPYAKCKDIKKIINPAEGEAKPELLDNFEFTGNTSDINGFNGFIYKMYLQIPRTAKYPYTAALFTDYILTAEGFDVAWGGNYGYYSGNSNIPAADGKPILSWENMIMEDPSYIYSNFDDVKAFAVATKGKA